jgi:molybdate transport system regulatory protein
VLFRSPELGLRAGDIDGEDEGACADAGADGEETGGGDSEDFVEGDPCFCVDVEAGDAGGGGARLTPAGVQLLDAAQKLGTVRKQLLADMAPAHAKNNMPPTTMALAVRTSMRNQLIAKVMAVKTLGALAWVKVQLSEDMVWVAKITKESAQLLDLVPGMQIMLLCKATAVRISRLQLEKPGANRAQGKVTRHSRAKATEISLQIAPHISLIGFAEDEQIKTGETVYAYLEDSSLVLALV